MERSGAATCGKTVLTMIHILNRLSGDDLLSDPEDDPEEEEANEFDL